MLGRELAGLGDELLSRVSDEVDRRIMPAARRELTIKRSMLTDAGVTGGEILALREFFADPLRFSGPVDALSVTR